LAGLKKEKGYERKNSLGAKISDITKLYLTGLIIFFVILSLIHLFAVAPMYGYDKKELVIDFSSIIIFSLSLFAVKVFCELFILKLFCSLIDKINKKQFFHYKRG